MLGRRRNSQSRAAQGAVLESRQMIDVSLPHDVGTWGLILAVVALILAVPLGIVSILLAPKVKLWWFLRSVKGNANKLISLTEYREGLEREPLFTPMEEIMWRHQRNLIYLAHFLAYILILVIVLVPKVHPHMAIFETAQATKPALPFIFILVCSFVYFGGSVLSRLRRSSPDERKRVEKEIEEVVNKLRSKMPPQ
jgi:hypothetical protein